MAPIGDRDRQGSVIDENTEDEEGQNLWASILSEVQSSSSSKLPSCKSVLVLGDNECGKTTLVAKLQGADDPKKGSGLEYNYLDVKDEYRDDHTRLGTWILDGDPHHTGLLKFALSEENFEHTIVLLVVSMGHPWAIMDSLKKWSAILRDHIDLLRIPPEQMRDFEQSLVTHFQEYVEPEEGKESHTQPARRGPNPLHPVASQDEDKVLLPLGETTLTHNLGIPIVVVVTKSDAISTLEKEHDYREEHFDFIQQHIRKFCLNYGASLFYSSVKEDKNCDLLLKYLLHRIYGFPFSATALVVERDAVFIPAGWDNEKKISILYENMTSMKPDDSYDDVIAKPVMRKPIQREVEVLAEDEQAFLMKQQMQLTKQAPSGSGGQRESPMRPSPGAQKQSPRAPGAAAANAAGLAASPKKAGMEGARAGSTSEGVLANFFNSLLSKKTGGAGGPEGGPPGPGGPSAPGPRGTAKTDKAAVTRDAAAELDRMTRAKKPIPGQNSTGGAS
ncbi:cytoplasmic dynein 1 light intermediate chain 2-like isoform X2 [Lineus longissimus]|uniref:cytoplasmic dynein 1 light intermediate chain 2-like isoform X2 n=1 Tax=Lineus longissimus TaxID=88925 RepID=UPI002B4C28BD